MYNVRIGEGDMLNMSLNMPNVLYLFHISMYIRYYMYTWILAYVNVGSEFKLSGSSSLSGFGIIIMGPVLEETTN